MLGLVIMVCSINPLRALYVVMCMFGCIVIPPCPCAIPPPMFIPGFICCTRFATMCICWGWLGIMDGPWCIIGRLTCIMPACCDIMPCCWAMFTGMREMFGLAEGCRTAPPPPTKFIICCCWDCMGFICELIAGAEEVIP